MWHMKRAEAALVQHLHKQLAQDSRGSAPTSKGAKQTTAAGVQRG